MIGSESASESEAGRREALRRAHEKWLHEVLQPTHRAVCLPLKELDDPGNAGPESNWRNRYRDPS
jgi:hypothetical protein